MNKNNKINKIQIRKEIRLKVRDIDLEEKKLKDEAICSYIFAYISTLKIGHLGLYFPMKDEVNIKPLIERLFNSEWKLFFPRSYMTEDFIKYEMARVSGFDDLESARYGILEPKKKCIVERPENIDIWLVPGIAFSKRGIRLGRGGGFYDRLLQFSKGTNIGILYEVQLYDELPEEVHDIRMNVLITESGIQKM